MCQRAIHHMNSNMVFLIVPFSWRRYPYRCLCQLKCIDIVHIYIFFLLSLIVASAAALLSSLNSKSCGNVISPRHNLCQWCDRKMTLAWIDTNWQMLRGVMANRPQPHSWQKRPELLKKLHGRKPAHTLLEWWCAKLLLHPSPQPCAGGVPYELCTCAGRTSWPASSHTWVPLVWVIWIPWGPAQISVSALLGATAAPGLSAASKLKQILPSR